MAEEGSGIHWLSQAGGQKIEPLAASFNSSIGNILVTHETLEHDQAVRQYGPFSKEAKEAFKKVKASREFLEGCWNLFMLLRPRPL